MNEQLTPDIFKQKVMAAHPEYAKATASDGVSYSTMDATDFTKRYAQKYPDAITKDGHKYADYLPKSPEAKPQSLGSKILSGIGSAYNAIASPIIGTAAIPLQAGVAAYNKLTGSHVADPYAKGIPNVLGAENTNVTPLDLEKKAGDIAQVGSMFIPGEGILGAMGTGAVMGAGSQMSQGKNFGETVLGGIEGGVLGGGVAGVTKLAGLGLGKLGDLASGESTNKAIQGIKDAYSSALNLSASERGFENRANKDLAKVLMDNHAPLGRYADNGTLDASGAIEKLQSVLDPLNKQASELLNKPQGLVSNISLEDIAKTVNDRINSSKIPSTQAKAMQKQLQIFIADEAEKYGTEVTPAVADAIKQSFQNSVFNKAITPEGKLVNNVQYLLSDELKNATEKSIAGTDAGDVLGALNKKRSDLIDAIVRLTKADGVTKVKGGQLGNMWGGLTGTIMGSAGGNPFTALAGDYFGTKAAEFLNNPATKIAIAEGKAKATGVLPGILGKNSQPIGNTLTKTGNFIKKGARPAGLISNVLTK